jgi:hypothetical protein
MQKSDSETLFFQCCRAISGEVESIGTVKNNGRRVAHFPPSWSIPLFLLDADPDEIDAELLEEVCVNLTPIERRTWLQILDGRSPAEIARDEGVSNAAIHSRIRGEKGRGGMVAKNPYVRHWRRLRQEQRKRP